MKMTIHDKTLEVLEGLAISDTSDRNPIIPDSPGVALRYNAIQISQNPTGLVEIQFLWKGETVFTVSHECDLLAGNTIIVLGVTGKTKLNLGS